MKVHIEFELPKWSEKMRPAILCSLALVMLPASALADDKQACLDAADKAQTLRQQHKPLAAREPLRACVRDVCPTAIVKDCTTWFDENAGLIPTLQLVAKDGRGNELVDVRVSMDGLPLTQKLDGKMVDVEVGEHVFVFENAEGTKVERRITVHEGQKGQQILGDFPAPPEPVKPSPAPPTPNSTAPAPDAATPAADASGGTSTMKYVGYGAAGLGVVGLGLGTVFGVMSIGDKGKCASDGTCPAQSNIDDAKSHATISTIGFVAGGVLAAGGVALIVFAPSSASSAPAQGSAGLRITPIVAQRCGGISLGGRW